jgi:hypothetical protein
LSHEIPDRRKSDCTLGGTPLRIAHRQQSIDKTTVDMTFTFSYDSLPKAVVVGERIEVPITLTVTGEHVNENASASAGFLGYPDSLDVVSYSLVGCAGSPEAMPAQRGTGSILFSGAPSDPSRTFEFVATLSDTTSVSASCKTRYIYEFVSANP